MNNLLAAEASIKHLLKPIFFRDEVAARRVRFGAGKGLTLLLNRRHELQKELGLWEVEAQPHYRRWITPGSTVFDVGAADGDSALLLARLAAPGTVVAFEPDPAMRARFPHNAALNPDLPPPVVLPWFVGARDGDGGYVSLDGVVARREAPPPAFVKIDVDGTELDVLAGARRLLATYRPVMFVEVHGLDREHECDAWLTSCGYAVQIVKNAWWRTLYPEHRPIGHNRWLLAVPRPGGVPAMTAP